MSSAPAPTPPSGDPGLRSRSGVCEGGCRSAPHDDGTGPDVRGRIRSLRRQIDELALLVAGEVVAEPGSGPTGADGPEPGGSRTAGSSSGGEIGALTDLAGVADALQSVMVDLTGRIEAGMLAQRRSGLPLGDLLAMSTRMTGADRRALLRTTAGLDRLPCLAAAFRAGTIGLGEVRAVLAATRRLDADGRAQIDLLFDDQARLARLDADTVVDEATSQAMQLEARKADDDRVKAYERRFLAVQPGLDGTLAGYFEIDDRCGALLLRALEDAAVPLTEPRALTRDATTPTDRVEPDRRTLGRRRADALVAMAEHWLDGRASDGEVPTDVGAAGAEPDPDGLPTAATDGWSHGSPRPRRAPRRARPLVYVWTDIRTLLGTDASAAAARLLWDTLGPAPALTPAALQRVAADARLRFILADGAEVLGVSAPTDTIPARVRAAVQARDHSCRFPGCRVPARQTDVHHVVARSDGGCTVVDNLVALCRRHHGAVTLARWKLTMTADGVVTVRRGRHVATSDPPVVRRL